MMQKTRETGNGALRGSESPTEACQPIRRAVFVQARVQNALEAAGYPRATAEVEGWLAWEDGLGITVSHGTAPRSTQVASVPSRDVAPLVHYIREIRGAGLACRVVSDYFPVIEVHDPSGVADLDYKSSLYQLRWIDLDGELQSIHKRRATLLGQLASVEQELEAAREEKTALMTQWGLVQAQIAAIGREKEADGDETD
jgi:hypothetical protein